MDIKENNLQLFREYCSGNKKDKHLRDVIFMNNMKLVSSIVNPFRYRYDFEDIKQEGYRGLIEAIDNFDIQKNIAFSIYATKFIRGYVLNYINGNNEIHISDEAMRKKLKIQKFEREYYNRYHCLPSIEDISNCTGISEKWILRIKQAPDINNVLSLNYSNTNDNDNDLGLLNITESDTSAENICLKNMLKSMLEEKLLEVVQDITKYKKHDRGTRSYEIFCKHLGIDDYQPMTQKELAQEYNMTTQNVGQIISRINHLLQSSNIKERIREEFIIPITLTDENVVSYLMNEDFEYDV